MGILETLISPMISGVMGTYFSNFDSSKLDIGMGNVELVDMLVRPGILDEMGVPLKLVFGKVGRIYLEFGIMSFAMNMAGKRDVVASIKDVYVLLAPPTSVPYQDDTEEKKLAKRKALEKLIASDSTLTVGPVEAESSGTMIAEIINNIKVTVENIHIRYEDAQANPGSPFAFGLTLKKLEAISTDSNWQPKDTGLTETTFFKLVSLESLGVYWNSNASLVRPRMVTPQAEQASIVKMQNLIDSHKNELKYLIGPLTGEIKAIVTMKPNKLPEKFSKPMADVTLSLRGFNIVVTNEQFHDALLLMQTLEDQSRRTPYLAFRPYGITYEHNAKKWWTYAYKCVRIGVERRNRIYDANYLTKQLKLQKKYELEYADYRQRVGTKEAKDDDKIKYEALEDDISNQDILIIRKRVAMKDKKVVDSQEVKSGWWSSYKVALDPTKLKHILEEKLSPEEMKEIERLVSFEPDDIDARNFPPGYTQMKFKFALPQFAVTVREVEETGEQLDIIKVMMNDFCTRTAMHPAEKGMAVNLEISSLTITGFGIDDDDKPSLLRDLTAPDEKFVTLSYAKNPLDDKPGQHIKINSERVEVIYDSPTLQKLIDIFTWPSGVELAKTKAAVGGAMDNAKNMSVNGMKEMIENTEEIFLDIFSKAPYFMLPSGGSMRDADTILVLNSGDFKFSTTPRERSVTDGSAIESVGTSEDGNVSKDIQRLTYNQYVATHSDLECFVALKGEDIQAAINHTFPPSPPGTYHADRPTQLFFVKEMLLNVNQCIIKDDPRFPKIVVEISMPLLDFSSSDLRLLKLIKLFATIPLPETKPPPPSAFLAGGDSDVFATESELDSRVKESIVAIPTEPTEETYDPESAVQFTLLMFQFEVKLMKILLLRLNETGSSTTPLLDLEFHRAASFMKFRTFGLTVDATCGSINASYLNARVKGQKPGTKVYLLKTPEAMDPPLIKVHMFSISEACPPSRVGDVRQKFSVKTQCVDLVLHQECLEDLLHLADQFLVEFTTARARKPLKPVPEVPQPVSTSIAPKSQDSNKATKLMNALGVKNLPNAGDILVKANAIFAEFSVSLTSENGEIAFFYVGEIVGDYEDKPFKTRMYVQIKDVQVTNKVEPSFYKRIMNTGTDQAFINASVTMYKDATEPTDPDIEATLQLNCPPLICLGENVASIVDFAAHLLEAIKTFKENDEIAATDDEDYEHVEGEEHQIVKHKTAIHIDPIPQVVDPYATDKKLSLNIKFLSPKLIIVKGPVSPEAVVVDLGNLFVTNSLHVVKNKGGHAAVMDDMSITLEGIQMSRALIDPATEDIMASVYIIEPVQIKLNLQRSLSAWYKPLPLIELSGQLDPLAFKVSAFDVEVAATCIINYVKSVQRSYKKLQALRDTPDLPEDETAQPDSDPDQSLGSGDTDLEEDGPIPHKIGAAIRLAQIGIFIYQTPTLLDGKTGSVERDPAGSLAEFYVQTVDAKMQLFYNEMIYINLIINELLLRDARPETGNIKDFLAKKEDAANPNAPVIQARFTQEKSLSGRDIYNVNYVFQGLTFVVYLEFARLIVDFSLAIANSLPKEDPHLKLEDASAVKLDAKTKTTKKPSMKMAGIKAEDRHLFDRAGEQYGFSVPLITGEVTFSETDFVFLESTYSTETNAIIAYGSSKFKIDSEEGKGSWGGGSWTYAVITAKYSPDKPNEQVCFVMEPITLSVNTSLTDEEGIVIETEFSNALLHINAGTLLLVKKFVTKIQETVEKANQIKADNDLARKDYANVWSPRDNAEQDYWFLDVAALTRTANRHKITDLELLTSEPTETKLPEKLTLKLIRGSFVIEAGVSTKPTAMLLTDGSINLEVLNWSSDLKVKGHVGGNMSYNNITKGGWEYIVEPNENDDGTFQPWTFNVNVSKSSATAGKQGILATISSDDVFELTVTRSAINLIKALAENFKNSLSYGVSESDIDTPPYVFHNDAYTDIYVTLNEEETGLTYTSETKVENGAVLVKQGELLPFGMKLQDAGGTAGSGGDQKDRLLSIHIPEFQDFQASISARYNCTAYYQLTDSQGRVFGMLVEVKGEANFSTRIVARSIVQLRSELSTPVEVTAVVGDQQIPVGTLKPFTPMNLPLEALHNGTSGIALKFTAEGFKTSGSSNALTVLANPKTPAIQEVVVTKPLSGGGAGNITIIGTAQTMPIYGSNRYGQSFNLVLKPPLVINNFIPLELDVSPDGKNFTTAQPGSPIDLLTANTDTTSNQVFFRIRNYQSTTWTAHIRLKLKSGSDKLMFLGSDDSIIIGQINSIKFVSETGKNLYFRFRPTVFQHKLEEISLFCPYWLVNRTGLPLSYQGKSSHNPPVVIDDKPSDEPKLMAYDVDGKEQCKFSVDGSKFSEPLTLDTPMSADFVCHGTGRDYELVVSVELSPTNLTKIVSVVPKHMVVNTCPVDVMLAQVGESSESDLVIPANTTVPFWPIRRTGVGLDFVLKVVGTEDFTAPFRYDGVHISLLKLDNKYGGFLVNVSVLATKGILTIGDFNIGEAPVLIVNDTKDLDIEFNQESMQEIRTVPQGKSVVYTWDSLGKPETIHWTVTQFKDSNFTEQFQASISASGNIDAPDPNDDQQMKKYTWSAFASGLRTIFVLTDNKALVGAIKDYLAIGHADDSVLANPLEFEVNLELEGIGLSIVDDEACKDILYVRLDSTPPMWEGTNIGGSNYRTMTPQETLALEKGYTNFVSGTNTKVPAIIDNNIKINYTNFKMSAPKSQQLRRRAHRPGVSARISIHEFSKEVMLTIAKLQIDNQLEQTEFPHLFVAAPLQKSVADKTQIPPPLFIFNWKDRSQGGSGETINGSVVLQGICVGVDSTFLMNLLTLFGESGTRAMAPKTKAMYDYDQKRALSTDKSYFKSVGDQASTSDGAVVFYELFQVYKLNIETSVTLSEDPDGGILYNMLLGIGSGVVSATKAQIAIDGMEIKKKRWTREQVTEAVISHYKYGIIGQLYKVVLGIDLLGNPTKLLGDIGSGLGSLVTEPFAGAMEGNLVEGITNGATAAVGGTVVGITDALGNVTKQLGKLTKGLGLVPVAQLFTGISSGFLGVGKVFSDEPVIESLRPRRVMFPDHPLKPYSISGTMGDTVYKRVLYEYPDAGPYILHYTCEDKDGNYEVLLLTQNRVYCAGCTPKIESLNKKWAHAWTELEKIERSRTSGLIFKEQVKKSRGFFSYGTPVDSTAIMPNDTVAKAALKQCKKVMLAATGQ